MGKDAVEERERKTRSSVRRKPTGIASWDDCNGDILKRAICEAASVGGALRFGYSRDGGAFAIGVYGDGEPYTDFVSCKEDINETLLYYVELFSADEDKTKSGSQGTQNGKTGRK